MTVFIEFVASQMTREAFAEGKREALLATSDKGAKRLTARPVSGCGRVEEIDGLASNVESMVVIL